MEFNAKAKKDFRNNLFLNLKEFGDNHDINIQVLPGLRHTGKGIRAVIYAKPKYDNGKFENVNVDLTQSRMDQIKSLKDQGVTRLRDIITLTGMNKDYAQRLLKQLREGLVVALLAVMFSGCGLWTSIYSENQPKQKINRDTVQLISYPSKLDSISLVNYQSDTKGWEIIDRATKLKETGYNWKIDGKNWIGNDSTIYRTNYATNSTYKVEFKKDSVWVLLVK